MGFEDWMLEDGYGDEMEYMDYLERQYYKSCAKYIPSTNNIARISGDGKVKDAPFESVFTKA